MSSMVKVYPTSLHSHTSPERPGHSRKPGMSSIHSERNAVRFIDTIDMESAKKDKNDLVEFAIVLTNAVGKVLNKHILDYIGR